MYQRLLFPRSINRFVSQLILALTSLVVPVASATADTAGVTSVAFQTASVGGPTRFTRLSDTGIEFVSRLLPDHPLSYLYHSGLSCSGIATGDFNGDGRPDLFLANGPGKNALYLQAGNGLAFKDVTATIRAPIDGGDAWAAGVALADVDNDGDLDIFVCNYQAPNQLFINLGPVRGSIIQFKEVAASAGVARIDASHQAAFCDYDNDGDLDFYLLTNRIEDPAGALAELPVDFERPGTPRLQSGFEKYYDIWVVDADNWGVSPIGRDDVLYRNDGVDAEGNVRFTEVTKSAGISGRGDGLSCTWWDADLDGDCDLYVCNDFLSEDKFYVNNGDGTFTNRVAESMPHTTWFSMGSSAGDLDNDGDFDLLVADMAATSHYKSKVTMGIMGGMELQRANTSNPPQYMRNALFLNESNLQFREAAYLSKLSSSDWTWSIKMEDFDADGRLDVYFTNGVPREMNHSDIKITHEQLVGKHMWEFFKDGEMRKEQNLAFHNDGGLKFKDVSQQWGLDHRGASYGAVCADFDLDGDVDIAVMNLEENVAIYRNDGAVGAQLSLRLQGTRANRNGVGATVEVVAGDQRWVRQLMPGMGYHSYDEPVLHFGLGEVTRVDEIRVTWPGGGVQVIRDVAVNQRLTITQANDGVSPAERESRKPATMFEESPALEDLWHQENAFDDFALQPLLPHRLSAEGPCMAWGDVNGDGRMDVYLGGSADTAGELRLGDKQGQFRALTSSVFFANRKGEDSDAEFGDFDNDGDLDLIVGRGSYEFGEGDSRQQDVMFVNDGSGRFERAGADSLPESTKNTGAIANCDFDKDGDLDLFVGARVRHGAYPMSAGSQLWRNEGGKFTDATTEAAPELDGAGMITDATWADVDGDGWQDLLVSREWGTVACYRNLNGSRLVLMNNDGDLSQRTGWWAGLAAGDIDNDGDVDLVVSNVGLNTKYKTGVSNPMTVYYGDFDGSGKPHIVEVKREGKVCYPERGRSCSSNAMPFIAKKFKTFHDFGMATLSDVYGDSKLETAQKFEANTFEHGVFVNDGTGKFQYRPLPRITQIAPSAAVALADFDQDGDLDIVLGQNFFGPQSETGRYDGGFGQLLRNDGSGSFDPVPPAESGFIVRDAATAVTAVDIDGDQQVDLAVATNDGPIRLFLNRRSSSPDNE